MDKVKVVVAGRAPEVSMASRILDCLTRAGLLMPACTCEDGGDRVVLHVPAEDARVFEAAGFRVVKPKERTGQ